MTEKSFFQILLKLKQTNLIPPHFLVVMPNYFHAKFISKLAQFLLCLEHGNCSPRCAICQQVKNQNRDYFYQVTTEKDAINVADITPLLKWSNYQPVHSGIRLYCLPNIEYLNLSSANKLLKFLETSFPNLLGILTTSMPERLLPTIRSRLPKFHLDNPTFSESNVKKLLEKHQLTEQDRVVLDNFNRLQTKLDNRFITKKYQPWAELLKIINKMLLQKRPHDLFLISDELLALSDLAAFWNYCLIYWQLILRNHFEFQKEQKQMTVYTVPLFEIFTITKNHYVKTTELWYRTQQPLTNKNNVLHWLTEIIKVFQK